jgi:hypothetical protein
MAEGSREFTVVLAYGPTDAAAVAALVDEFARRKQTVLPVAIVDSDAPLLEACAKLGGRGLFVIARGSGFAASRAESLRVVLRDLGVPMSRSLVLALDGTGATPFVDRVVNVLRRITSGTEVGRTAPPVPKAATAAPMHDAAVGVTAPIDYATVPPSFDADGRAGTPTAPGILHSAAIAVDASPRVAPRGRRVALFATALASLAVLLWWALPATPVSSVPSNATEAAGPVADASAVPMPPRPVAPAAVPAVAAPAAEAATAPAIEDSDVIVDALRKREIRALDVFVVAPESKKAADFAGASAFCGALKVAGIDQWRLPEIGELISMSRAKMLRKGSYWSSTKGDTFGDFRLVLVVKRDRISPIPAGWDGGRVICVRERG